MISTWSSGVLSRQSSCTISILTRVLGGDAILLALLGDRVLQALLLGQGDANLVALGGGDPALLLQVVPGHVVLLRADQREDVGLAPILAHQRRRQAEPAARLDLGGDAEDRRGQQMDLVVDDQAPVVAGEQPEVREVAVLAGAVGEDLVGRDRDRADLFALAGVLADLLRR